MTLPFGKNILAHPGYPSLDLGTCPASVSISPFAPSMGVFDHFCSRKGQFLALLGGSIQFCFLFKKSLLGGPE